MSQPNIGAHDYPKAAVEYSVGRSSLHRCPSMSDAVVPFVTVIGIHSLAHPQAAGQTLPESVGPPNIDEHASAVGDGDLEAPLLGYSNNSAAADADAEVQRKLLFAYNVSWVVNIVLLGSKMYAYYFSDSKAVLASLVDSVVDLISQVVIFVADWRARSADPRFPVGQARLETIGVLVCALIMALASCEVVKESVEVLYQGISEGLLPNIDTNLLIYLILGGATLLKLLCYMLCLNLTSQSDSMAALAEDHLNDIMSNVAAAATALIATSIDNTWWVDSAGAIAISLFILWRWFDIARGQVDKIVGKGASKELIDELTQIADTHHNNLYVDCIRAYHFGARFFVEMEVVMPESYSLKQVHDISLTLQDRLESMEAVERAFVHVDYMRRDQPEHRTERLLAGLPVLPKTLVRGNSL